MKRTIFVLVLSLSACSTRSPGNGVFDDMGTSDAAVSEDASTADTGTHDAGIHDAGPSDLGATDMNVSTDSGTLDGGGSDASASDAALADSAVPTDAGPCEYIDLVPFVARCDGELTSGTSWVNIAGESAECPTYYTFNTATGASEVEVIDEAGCSSSCIYHATIAVDLLFCGHRFGYESYEAPDPGACPSLVSVGGGFYSSFDEYAAMHPCPDAGSAGAMPIDPPAE